MLSTGIALSQASKNPLQKILDRRYFIPAALIVAAILAVVVFVFDVGDFQPILQFWLVLIVISVTGSVVTSRRVQEARRWYGTDWWLAVISGISIAGFLVLCIIPEYIAPFEYDEVVGLSRMAPGEEPPTYILITRTELPYTSFRDIGFDGEGNLINQDNGNLGAMRGVGSIDNNAGQVIGSERDKYGITVDVNRAARDMNAREALQALSESDVLAARGRPLVALIGDKAQFESLIPEFSNLRIVGELGPTYYTPLLGTNNLGEDVFSRLIYGARTTVIIGMMSALLSCVVGIPIGLISGYIGGFFDRVLSLVMDSLYSFPGLILAIAIAAVLGRGIGTVIFALGVIYVPIYYRIVRSQTLAIREVAYVEAARSLGATNSIILLRYVFPNVIASVVVIFSINVADAVLTGAGLSFLGLGLPETIPDWGVDLARNQAYWRSEWWLVALPGLAITLLVLFFSLLGESLSEILNPRLNKA